MFSIDADWLRARPRSVAEPFCARWGKGCAFIVFMRISSRALAFAASSGNKTQRQFVADAIIAEQLLGSVLSRRFWIRTDQFRCSVNHFIDHSRIRHQSVVP